MTRLRAPAWRPVPTGIPRAGRGGIPPQRRYRARAAAARAVVAVLAGAAVGLLVGGRAGAPAGLLASAVTYRLWPRLRATADDRRAAAARSDLPFVLEMLAACLRAGATTEAALGAVASAADGLLAESFRAVLAALRAGADPRDAWARLADLPAGGRVAAAAARSAESGAALSAALARVADGLREARAVEVEAAARRAAVLIVLPLGLCFLPAFVLAGVMPVVLSVLGGLTAGPS